MNKPEYSDLYKFLVSLGFVLIVFAVSLPLLIINESFDVALPSSDIDKLTPTAQALIAYKQTIGLWLIKYFHLISLIIFITGIILLMPGINLWKKKQKMIDRKEELEKEKLELEIKKMTPEQIVEKAIKEVSEENHLIEVENDYGSETVNYINPINKYLQIENLVIRKLKDCFTPENIRSHIRIKNIEIDVLIRMSQKKRAIVEIKSIKCPTSYEQREKVIKEQLIRIINCYNSNATSRCTYGIGLLIVDDKFLDKIPFHPNTVTNQRINNYLIRIITLSESNFANFGCNELKTLITK